MNPVDLLNFLKDKKGKDYPVKAKIIYGIPLTDKDRKADGYIVVNSWLNLTGSDITFLPNKLIIKGSLMLTNSKIKELPNQLIVKADLFLGGTQIKDLPNDLIVKGEIFASEEALGSLDNPNSLLGKYGKRTKWRFLTQGEIEENYNIT